MEISLFILGILGAWGYDKLIYRRVTGIGWAAAILTVLALFVFAHWGM